MITVDEVKLPMQNINYLQGSSTLRALKLNHSLEPQSTQDATKCVTRILDAKYKKADLQSIVRDNCKHLSANHQKKLLQLLKKYELLFDGTLGDCHRPWPYGGKHSSLKSRDSLNSQSLM
jgi:hypothetical protein